MDYFKFSSHVVDKELRFFNLDVPTYTKYVLELKSNFDENFTSPYPRCAFMYRYATSILYFTEHCVLNFLFSFEGIYSLLAHWDEKKICSLSFGPGLDYLALQIAISGFLGTPVKFHSIYVSTEFGTWKNTFAFIIESIQKGNLKLLSSLPLANVDFFQKKDPLSVSTDILKNSDIVLMVKTLNLQSSADNNKELINKLEGLFSSMKAYGTVLFLDNRLSANLLLKVLALFPGVFLCEPKFDSERISLALPQTYKDIHGEFPFVTPRGVFFVWRKTLAIPNWIPTPRFIKGTNTIIIDSKGVEISVVQSQCTAGSKLKKNNSMNSSLSSLSSNSSQPGSSNFSLSPICNTKKSNIIKECKPNKKEVVPETVKAPENKTAARTAVSNLKKNPLNSSISSVSSSSSEPGSSKIIESPICNMKKSELVKECKSNKKEVPVITAENKTAARAITKSSMELINDASLNALNVQKAANNESKQVSKPFTTEPSVGKEGNSVKTVEKFTQSQDQSFSTVAIQKGQSSIASLTKRIKQLVSVLEKDVSTSSSAGQSAYASFEKSCPVHNHDIKNSKVEKSNCPQCNENETSHCCGYHMACSCKTFCHCCPKMTNMSHRALCQNHLSNIQPSNCSQNSHCHTGGHVQPQCFRRNETYSSYNHFSCCVFGNPFESQQCGNPSGLQFGNAGSASCCRNSCNCSIDSKADVSDPTAVVTLNRIDPDVLLQIISTLKKDKEQ